MRAKEIEQRSREDWHCESSCDSIPILFCRIRQLEEGIKKVLKLPKMKKPSEFTFEKERLVIYLPKELYQELQKLLEV